MSYRAPISDMLFAMKELAGLDDVAALPGFEDATASTVESVLDEAARFFGAVWAPLNAVGDRQPAQWRDGAVSASPGFSDAFRRFAEGGWQGLAHPVEYGGQGLPKLVGAACLEMQSGANLSLATCPSLTDGAIEALLMAGSEAQKRRYLPRLVSGEWSGTMNFSGSYDRAWIQILTPPTLAGQTALVNYSSNYSEADQVSWAYFPAQRRTRMAPDYKYDTPAAAYGGALFWDEGNMFQGRMDRFDFKLTGKKELIVPYNNYRLSQLPTDDVFGAKHINPDAVRWERHRVWVVEATLKSDARHAYSKRTFYVDEDGWTIVEADGYGSRRQDAARRSQLSLPAL